MQSLRDIKKRIKSVKNIEQITKAMEVVSMTKMRKSQAFALKARPYAIAALEMLHNLVKRVPELPLILKERPVKNSLLVVITADKGLVGAFNENVLRKAQAWIEEKNKAGKKFEIVTVGKKAKEFFERRKIPARENFLGYGDFSTFEETKLISGLVIGGFISGEWDEVEAIYTHFRTTLKQEMVLRKIFPVTVGGIEEVVKGILPEHGKFAHSKDTVSDKAPHYYFEYKLEPSPEHILSALVPDLLKMHIHHIILESNASEHSARMVTMKNASDNARELKADLSLIYNKARQAGITSELAEVVAGREALEQ